MAPQANYLNFEEWYGGNGKKVRIDYLSIQEYIVLGIHIPSFFLGEEFVKFFSRLTILKNY